MLKKVLITGGTGFIGSNLIKFLGNEYYFINIGRNENVYCENVLWNLVDDLDEMQIDNVDIIIHCASIVGKDASSKSDYIDINVKSTLRLLEFCARNNIKKFILISTGGVYGLNENILNENDICNPNEIYSLSKFFSEKISELYKNKISIVVLRMFFPYGEGQNGRLLTNLTHNLINKNKITINKNGKPIINPIHIIDVVNIMKHIIESDCKGTFNICGNELISIKELCIKIAKELNISNYNFVYNTDSVSNLIGDNRKVCRMFDYNMKISIDKGIKLFLNSFS